MNNQEIIDNALMELEGIDFEELPEGLQQSFFIAHSGLMHISTVLENMESEE